MPVSAYKQPGVAGCGEVVVVKALNVERERTESWGKYFHVKL